MRIFWGKTMKDGSAFAVLLTQVTFSKPIQCPWPAVCVYIRPYALLVSNLPPMHQCHQDISYMFDRRIWSIVLLWVGLLLLYCTRLCFFLPLHSYIEYSSILYSVYTDWHWLLSLELLCICSHFNISHQANRQQRTVIITVMSGDFGLLLQKSIHIL